MRVGAGPFELALDQLLAPDAAAPRLPELRLQRAQRDPAVGALVGSIADQRARQRQTAAAGHGPVGEVRAGDHRQPRERAVGHRDVHDLALSGAGLRGSSAAGLCRCAIALAQRREDAEGAHQRAPAEIGDLAGGLNGMPAHPLPAHPVAIAGEPQQSDEPEVVHVVAGGVALGAGLAVARDRAVDDPGVDLAHALVADAEPVEDTGTEGLEHDVVLAHQAQQHLAPALALEIDADRALVAVQRQEQRRLRAVIGTLDIGRGPADVVAHAGVLDLQDLRAEVGEQQRAEAAGQQAREVEDADAFQGQAHDSSARLEGRGDLGRIRAARLATEAAFVPASCRHPTAVAIDIDIAGIRAPGELNRRHQPAEPIRMTAR